MTENISVKADRGWLLVLLLAIPFAAIGLLFIGSAVHSLWLAFPLLFGDPRWRELLFQGGFGIVFGGIGFGLLAGMVWGRRKEARERQAKAQHPDEPWLWNPDWGSGLIRSSSRGEMLVALVIAGLWNAITVPLTINFLMDPRSAQERGRLALLIFPIAGIALGVWAVRAVIRYRKYGVSTLQLSKVPGVIGGPLTGVVQIPVHVVPEDGFHVTLRCVHRYMTGSGKNRHTTEAVLWEDEHVIGCELCKDDPTRSAIPVLFGIPRSCQPTRPDPGSDQILWRVEVTAKTPGVDYASQFEVPVFVTPASTDDFRLDEGLIRKYEKEQVPADLFKTNDLRLEQLPGRQILVFPAARHKGMALMMFAFAAIWTVIVVAMVKAGAPLFMTILFGLVDLAVLWSVLVVWLESRRVEIGPQEVTLSGGILGIGRTHRLRRDEVSDVVVSGGMQSGNKSYFTLKLRTKDGRSLKMGTRILGMHSTETLAAEITKEIVI